MYEVFNNLLVWSLFLSFFFFFWCYKFPFACLKRPTLTSPNARRIWINLRADSIYLCSFYSFRVSNRSSDTENTKSKRERTCNVVYDIVTITKNNKEYRVSVEMLRFLALSIRWWEISAETCHYVQRFNVKVKHARPPRRRWLSTWNRKKERFNTFIRAVLTDRNEFSYFSLFFFFSLLSVFPSL